MKQCIAFLFIATAVTLTACHKSVSVSQQHKLKARFEIAGLCSNYTFSLIEGNLDTSLVVGSWTNPSTDKTYKNAFSVSNPCSLPSNLKEGDEFYFEIVPERQSNCAVCMAYYPTPPKKLNIKVLEVVKK